MILSDTEVKAVEAQSKLNVAQFYVKTLVAIAEGRHRAPKRSSGYTKSNHPAKQLQKYGLAQFKRNGKLSGYTLTALGYSILQKIMANQVQATTRPIGSKGSII